MLAGGAYSDCAPCSFEHTPNATLPHDPQACTWTNVVL